MQGSSSHAFWLNSLGHVLHKHSSDIYCVPAAGPAAMKEGACQEGPAAIKENAYQEVLSPEFMASADVYLIVAGKTYHAHSQFLAAQSSLLLRMLQDIETPPCPKQPWILEIPFQHCNNTTMETFLSAVYRPPSFSFNGNDAWDLLDVADFLECTRMLNAGQVLLESQSGGSAVQQAVLQTCFS